MLGVGSINPLQEQNCRTMDTCKVKVCRICFAMDCQLHHLYKKKGLCEEYQLLIDTMISEERGLPLYLCTTCAERLLNFAQFRQVALRAYSILLAILDYVDDISVESIQTVIKRTYRNFDIKEEDEIIFGDVTNEIETELHDEIETGCMRDDGDEETVVAPCVLETNDIVKEEVSDEDSVMDDDRELRAGEDVSLDPGPSRQDDERNETLVESIQPVIKHTYSLSNIGRAEKERTFGDATGEIEIKQEDKPTDVLVRQLLDEIETECMRDDGADHDETVVAPCVMETYDIVKEEVIDEQSVVDDDRRLGTGQDVSLEDGPSGQDDELNKVDEREVVREYVNQRDGYQQQRSDVNKIQNLKLSCDLCAYKTDNKTQFLGHFKAHAKNILHLMSDYKMKSKTEIPTLHSQHSCDTCGKTFSSVQRLRKHSCSQLGRDFSCDICKKSFRRKSSLINHMLTHFGKKYGCAVCNKSYRSMSELKNHMIKHLSNELFACKVCKRSFADRNSLRLHMIQQSHGKPYSCGICRKTYSGEGYLRRHVEKHSISLV